MIARESGESATANAGASQYIGDARQVSDRRPVEFDIERDETEAAFDARLTRRMPDGAPVLFVKQERHFMLVAQEHEGGVGAWAQLGVLQKARPVFVAQADQKIGV